MREVFARLERTHAQQVRPCRDRVFFLRRRQPRRVFARIKQLPVGRQRHDVNTFRREPRVIAKIVFRRLGNGHDTVRRSQPPHDVCVIIPILGRERLRQQERDHVINRLHDGEAFAPACGVGHGRVRRVEYLRAVERPGQPLGVDEPRPGERGVSARETLRFLRVFRRAKRHVATLHGLQARALFDEHARHPGNPGRIILAKTQQRQVVEDVHLE